MEGKVVANFDALAGARSNAVAIAESGATAVVFFPNDAVGLSAESRLQVDAVVEQFRAAGGQLQKLVTPTRSPPAPSS